MTRSTACEGVIKAGDTPTVVAQVTGWTREVSNNIKSFYELGNCNEQHEAGGTSTSYSLEVTWDATDTGQTEILTAGTTVAIEIYPIGDTSGNDYWDATGVIESVSISGSGDDFITASISAKITTETTSTVA